MVEWLDRQPRNRYTRVPHVLFKSLPNMLVSDTAEIVTSFKLKNRLTKFTAWPQSESRKNYCLGYYLEIMLGAQTS